MLVSLLYEPFRLTDGVGKLAEDLLEIWCLCPILTVAGVVYEKVCVLDFCWDYMRGIWRECQC